jgi:6-phosphogluconolactonase
MTIAADLRIVDDLRGLAQAAAEEFATQALGTVRANGRFTAALSGGSTPRSLFSLLAANFRDQLPWDKMFFFWGDERHVPPDNPESNYRMANETLLSKVPVPAENVFRVHAENPDTNQAAADYEQTLRKFFQLSPGALPRFDLILLGMGPDGHTASLFPKTTALGEKSRLVVANWVDRFKTHRITFTLPVLNNAAVATFLVGGADKAETVREVLEGNRPGELFPAKLVHPTNGRMVWMVDQAAAAVLSKA